MEPAFVSRVNIFRQTMQKGSIPMTATQPWRTLQYISVLWPLPDTVHLSITQDGWNCGSMSGKLVAVLSLNVQPSHSVFWAHRMVGRS